MLVVAKLTTTMERMCTHRYDNAASGTRLAFRASAWATSSTPAALYVEQTHLPFKHPSYYAEYMFCAVACRDHQGAPTA